MAKRGVSVLVMSVSQIVGYFTEQDVVCLASGVDWKTTKISEVIHSCVMTLKLTMRHSLKSYFVGMTYHEFCRLLSTNLYFADLLEHYRHKWSEDKQLTHLHRIQRAVKRMTEMLNDVLLIGKVEAGKLEFRPKSLDLVAYCRHLVEKIQLNLQQ